MSDIFFNIAIGLILFIALLGFINGRRMDGRFNRILTQIESELERMQQEDRDVDYISHPKR